MNKKSIVTKENINKVANFIKKSVEWLIDNDCGCCHYALSGDLSLCCGWQDGYDMNDTNIIKSQHDQQKIGTCACGYAITCGIRVKNDFESDFGYLSFLTWVEDGEACDCDLAPKPNMTKRDYNKMARWFLENYVSYTNGLKKGTIIIEG